MHSTTDAGAAYPAAAGATQNGRHPWALGRCTRPRATARRTQQELTSFATRQVLTQCIYPPVSAHAFGLTCWHVEQQAPARRTRPPALARCTQTPVLGDTQQRISTLTETHWRLAKRRKGNYQVLPVTCPLLPKRPHEPSDADRTARSATDWCAVGGF